MRWITVRYFPGFASDLTSWEIQIESDGLLSQTVNVCRFSPYVKRTDYYLAQLSSEQIAELQQLIAETDFDAVSAVARSVTMDDADQCAVIVSEKDRILEFSASLAWLPFLQRQGHFPEFDWSPALRLWDALDNLSPYRVHSEEE